MVVNGRALLQAAPIVDMLSTKESLGGVSFGLAEVGYDIRLKQDVNFFPRPLAMRWVMVKDALSDSPAETCEGNFAIASAMEEFRMPCDLMGIVHDKSTWARQGLSVFNTVIEPGWNGFLTLELVYHGNKELFLPAGTGIAQVVFHKVIEPAQYQGKYQDQADQPVESIFVDHIPLKQSEIAEFLSVSIPA